MYTPERLAYWYFRLNGFLTTENFIVHPDEGQNQRTDADLLAVRFMYRAENLVSPMQDDPRVADCSSFANIIIAEIKTGRCALNGPWTDPARMNMERVLRAIGCVDEQGVQHAASCLYRNGLWQNGTVSVRLFAVGEEKAQLLIPENQQLTWSEIIQFLVDRFNGYRRQKSSVGQWTLDGRKLQRYAWTNSEGEIRRLFKISPRDATMPELIRSGRKARPLMIEDVQAGLEQQHGGTPVLKQAMMQELFTGRARLV